MIPKFEEFMPPVLSILADGKAYRNREIHAILEGDEYFNFSEEERKLKVKGGSSLVYKNRADWAITYLFQAGLLARPERGIYQITERGRNFLASGDEISAQALM